MNDKPEVTQPDEFLYYLAATEVFYEYKGKKDSKKLNAVIATREPKLRTQELGEIQKLVQMRLFKEIHAPSPDLRITDVFTASISFLGLMTQEEFQTREQINPEAVTAEIRETIKS